VGDIGCVASVFSWYYCSCIDRLHELLLYLNYLGARVSMSLEKFFCGESWVFLFVFVGLFGAGLVFWALFFLV